MIWSALLYYLLIIPLSVLPLRVLYFLSDILYLKLYYLFRYRVKVVRSNLLNSFPDKSREEILRIERKFYRHFCDLMFESIKLFSMSEAENRRRCTLTNPEILDEFYAKNRSVIIVSGHYNNWEIGGTIFPKYLKHRVMGIYSPLSNAFFNKKFALSRGKLGLTLVSKKEVSEWFALHDGEPWVSLFATDQSPTHSKSVFWLNFLNQETAVLTGTERFAQKYNQPVVYVHIDKLKRGYYQMSLTTLCDEPTQLREGEITELHTRMLEQKIIEHPEFWLWTHRRWKRKKTRESASQ